MSIVLLAILAVMWAAFLLPLVAPGQRGRSGRPPRAAGARDDGWRPARGSASRGPRRRPTQRQRRRREAALRRRRVLLTLTIAVGAAVRVWYLVGGIWSTVAVVTAALLLAYLATLLVLGWRRHRPARVPAGERPVRRRTRRRRQVDLSLWSAPLLEGQAPSRPE